MGKRYDQLDLDDRIEISRLHAAGIRFAIGSDSFAEQTGVGRFK